MYVMLQRATSVTFHGLVGRIYKQDKAVLPIDG
jgi:hypothetical protein